MDYKIGVDIGSISINTVIIDNAGKVLEENYDYCHGRPFHILHDRLKRILEDHKNDKLINIAFTGVGGKIAADLLGGLHVNEIIAQSRSVSEIHPEVRTIIEMGGEDSKLIFMDNGAVSQKSVLSDFSMNSLCAAGTGSFLDQQAKRIGVKIDKEFGELALKSEHPPRIAGRCSVFAKSDMIHLQQIATPVHDIVAGLCFAVARNLKSTLGRGKQIVPPVIFQGGVAANSGMVRAFREILDLKEEEFVVPKHFASMGALGSLMYSDDQQNGETEAFKGLKELEEYLNSYEKGADASLDKLYPTISDVNKEIMPLPETGPPLEVSLGLDVGSLSTNLVLLTDDNKVVARRYLPTASKPIEAIRIGLKEIEEEVGDRIKVKAAGTTGSGRYLTGDFIGADIIQNEITAQATATIFIDPEVDTIFEIGGQDSKYISIENGVIVDFEMNKVCAAGTGSFLEEQAEKLDINIKKQFESLAFEASNPAKLGDRCTVFMESDLNSLQQKGEEKENLIAGLAYSTVQNYLNRVVNDKPIGKKIYYQGGVTNNRAVVAAFEKITGQKIHVPPHFDITGAIGAAMLARDSMKNGDESRFRGFEVSEIRYETDKFICDHCANNCEIRKVSVEGRDPLYYGGICDRYEIEERKGIGKDIPNLFKERTKMLLDGYKPKKNSGKPTIGIPRELTIFYQQFPFWRTLWEDLGFEVVLSSPSSKKMLTKSIDLMTAETCLPIEMIFGHVDDLLNKKVDHVFLPFLVNSEASEDNPTSNCNCPWVQSHPFMVKAAYRDSEILNKLLIPSFHLRHFETAFQKEFVKFAKEQFNIPKKQALAATVKARAAQRGFEESIRLRGKEVMANLPEDKRIFIVLGRPYNTSDPALNLNLVEKLIGVDVLPVPLDFLPIEEENIFDFYPMMYWPNGDKILRAVKHISKNDRLNAVFLGNFRCGPDSFLRHYMRREMKGKPFLHLEVDEHSANAGMITRIEAFLDSLDGYQGKLKKVKKFEEKPAGSLPINKRTVYFPYANDVVIALAAACRHVGISAEVLPMPNEESLEMGRKYTNGQECFPAIATTGSFLQKLHEPGIDPAKSAFFMPDHNGPCRFGGYNKLQEIIFERLGFKDVMMVHPSNEDNYTSIAPENPVAWRMVSWKGMVAIDLLRKLKEQTRPYESNKGDTDELYEIEMQNIVKSLEGGAKTLEKTLTAAARNFKAIPRIGGPRKPVIAVVGEIYMRDNPFCSANVVRRLEALGAETMMAPIAEWVSYSSYRYVRDSRWKKNRKGVVKAKIQGGFQSYFEKNLVKAVEKVMPVGPFVHVADMLERCDDYIHHDYDGDPPLSIGTVSILSEGHIAGVMNILPFTCMPGTLNCSISGSFRKDHKNIPWENFAYDGQVDSSIDSRLQAFMHQAKEYAEREKLHQAVE